MTKNSAKPLGNPSHPDAILLAIGAAPAPHTLLYFARTRLTRAVDSIERGNFRMNIVRVVLWALGLIPVVTLPSGPSWQMKADYVEACSCHAFCQCYFNKTAEHPHCEFNMAVKVREG